MKFNSQNVDPCLQHLSAIEFCTMFDTINIISQLVHGTCLHNSGKTKSVTVVHILPIAQ